MTESQKLNNKPKQKNNFLFLYTRVRAWAVFVLVLLSMIFTQAVLAESSASPSYRLDYARLTSDSDQKNSLNFILTDSISDISVEGSSASYNLRNVYAGSAVTGGAVCGNAIIETGEQCEGVNFNGLTCSSYGFNSGSLQCAGCLIVTTSCFNTNEGGGGGFICGNGIREASEQCDDNNTLSGDGCSAGCRLEEQRCGNGIKETGEQCDDGNGNTGDGCTPACVLEIPEVIPPEVSPEEPVTEPEKPTIPEPEKPTVTEPGEKQEPAITPEKPKPEGGVPVELPPLKPSAPETSGIGILGNYDYHFNDYGTGQKVSILDETPFVVTEAEPNAVYEMVILDENGKVMTRQGVQSTPQGVLMFESIPFLEYKTYSIELYSQDREVFKSWTISIEDHDYREHDNLSTNNELNREYISLGSFKKITDISGVGKPNSKYHAYLQRIETQHKGVSEITHVTATADAQGDYKLMLPENLKDGSYLMNVVQVYADGKISRNKRYIFDVSTPSEQKNIWVLIAVFTILAVGQAIKPRQTGKQEKKKGKKRIEKKKRNGFTIRTLLSVALTASLILQQATAFAAVTTPAVFIYEGKLLDSANSPITTPQTFRFSLWSSDDFVAGDVTGAGAINVGAPAYGGWFETQTITPNSDGTFSAELGSVTPLPNMLLTTHKDLMVEIKASAAPDTSYELMDPTGDNGTDANDRQTVGSTPYTNNADFIDNAEVGTGAGDIATLGIGGIWDINYMPGGTNSDSWTLDVNDTVGAGGTIDLVFGTTLAQTLSFDVTNDWFSFSNDVDLGQHEIKNVIIDNQAAPPGAPLAGQIYHNTGDGNTYIWSGTAWDNITAASGASIKTLVFNAAYADSVAIGDGADNRGTLNSDSVNIGPTQYNFYQWNTLQSTIQDVDVKFSIKLPNDFASFTVTPLKITYNTNDGVAGNNKVDVQLYDTTNTPVALAGGSSLANPTWTTSNITFGGAPTFTAGGTITVVVKLSTISTGFARMADLVLEYNSL